MEKIVHLTLGTWIVAHVGHGILSVFYEKSPNAIIVPGIYAGLTLLVIAVWRRNRWAARVLAMVAAWTLIIEGIFIWQRELYGRFSIPVLVFDTIGMTAGLSYLVLYFSSHYERYFGSLGRSSPHLAVHLQSKLEEVRLNKVAANIVGTGLTLILCATGVALTRLLPHWVPFTPWHAVAFLVSFVGLLPIHELLHAVGLLKFAEVSRHQIRLGVMWHSLMPYCHCTVPIPVAAYRRMALLPMWIAGSILFIAMLIFPSDWLGAVAGLTVGTCVGDVWIVIKLRGFSDDLLVRDCPSEIGCDVISPIKETTELDHERPNETHGTKPSRSAGVACMKMRFQLLLLLWAITFASIAAVGQGQHPFDTVRNESPVSGPNILEAPQDRVAVAGDNVAFSVRADGTPPLIYQWYTWSNPIAGATNNSLSLTNVQLTDGVIYQVRITNAFGSATASTRLAVSPEVCSPFIYPLPDQLYAGDEVDLINFTIGDAATPAEQLTLSAASSNPALLPIDDSHIQFGDQGTNRAMIVLPAHGAFGQTTLTLTVHNQAGCTASTSFSITVPAPLLTISGIPDQGVLEGRATQALPVQVYSASTFPNFLKLSAASSNPNFISTSNIVFGGSGVNRTVTITPLTDGEGSSAITLTVGDNAGQTAQTVFTVARTTVLEFSRQAQSVLLSWKGLFVLEVATNVAGPFQENGTATNPVTLGPFESNHFYRLRRK